MFLLSVVVFIAVSCLGMVLGFSLSAYFDLVSCILVVFPALFFSAASTSLQALKQGFVILFNDKAEFSEQQCLSSKQSFNVLGTCALLMGVFSSLLGLIAIAGNTNFSITPERLGMAISVSLLTLYYGLGIKIICYVAEQKILHRLLKLKACN